MRAKILLAGFYNKQILKLKKKFKLLEFFEYGKKIKDIKKIDAFVSITRRSFEKFYYKDFKKCESTLSWMHISAAGIDKYFSKKVLNKKLVVTNGKIIQGPQVADHAFALLLALTRNLNLIIKHGLEYKFDRRPIELKGKSALIVGYGGVGRCVAERAHGFGMKVDVVNYKYSPISNIIRNFYLSEDYNKALIDKDVVFYTLPLTKKTNKLFNSGMIKYVKKGAFIINVCRGEIVCLKTLQQYLKNNYLGGAGLDVLDGEPINRSNKLLKLKNLVISPHIAGISDSLAERNIKLIEDNLRRFSSKSKLLNQVDPKEGF